MPETIYFENEDEVRTIDVCKYGECYEPKSSVRVSTVPEVEPDKEESD